MLPPLLRIPPLLLEPPLLRMLPPLFRERLLKLVERDLLLKLLLVRREEFILFELRLLPVIELRLLTLLLPELMLLPERELILFDLLAFAWFTLRATSDLL